MTELRDARVRGSADVRPGAMTSAMRAVAPEKGSRALRWALVRDGRIVTEAIVPPERALTIGAEGDVPCAGVRERTLARCEGGRWYLSVSPSWSGRVSDRALADRIAGEPRGDDGWVELALDDDARARVVIGEHALLVQIVERPVARTRQQLPAALQGGLFQRADWMFTAFIAASFLLHFAFVVGLIEADWPVETALIPPHVTGMIFIEPIEPPEAPIEPMVSETNDPVPEDTQTTTDPSNAAPSRNPNRGRPSPPSRSDENTDPRIAMEEALRAVHLGLGAVGQNGAMRNLIENGGPTGSSADILTGHEGIEIASTQAGIPGERGGSDCATCPDDGSLRRLAAGGRGTGPIDEGGPVREVVIPRPTPQEPDWIDPLPPGFDTRELIRALRMRMPAVQRCYEHELTRGNPDTEGRITLSITVMPVGSVANLSADENETGSEALAACTIRSLRNTRVRVGPSEPIEVHYPIVFRRPG